MTAAQREAEAGAPERVELAVAVAHGDEVRAADHHGAEERAEREPIGSSLHAATVMDGPPLLRIKHLI